MKNKFYFLIQFLRFIYIYYITYNGLEYIPPHHTPLIRKLSYMKSEIIYVLRL